MFSGIVEKTAEVLNIETKQTNKIFTISNPYGNEIYIDQSISHNGVCLTVIEFDEQSYKVEAILETLNVSNLDMLGQGDIVNLERCVQMHTRLDGHMVQGHVDAMATITNISNKDGSWEVSIRIPDEHRALVIQKGSIAINGISLTIMSIMDNIVTVAIIPYTYEHTNVNEWKVNAKLNIEFDVIGKYVLNYMRRSQDVLK
ncbi:MAG: riboflavin synthase [Saprospiraceae bacterium]|nr:riboflavin synthase [Saprospiraceae bacterium]